MHSNAFEDQTPVEKILPVHPEIQRLTDNVVRLRKLGLHQTADLVQLRLDRLLREEEGTLEG